MIGREPDASNPIGRGAAADAEDGGGRASPQIASRKRRGSAARMEAGPAFVHLPGGLPMIAQVDSLVRVTSTHGLTQGTVLSWIALAVSALVGLAGGYLMAYGKKRGENLATKHDFDELLRQVQRTTETAESIKTGLSRGLWLSQSEFEYRKQQLAEFYGPIYASLKLHEEFYDLWLDGRFQEINAAIVKRFQTNNEEMVKILATKAHLIDGPVMPEVFTRFTSNTILWNLYTSRPNAPYYPEHIKKLPIADFPDDFRTYIYGKTEEIKRIIDTLHHRHSTEAADGMTAPASP
jgi:hypothetical protein